VPSPEDSALLQGLGEAVEAERTACERAWGFGRLEALAGRDSPDLLARFRRQQVTWATAYQAAWAAEVLDRDKLGEVQAKCASMQRGWRALAAFAAEAGHREIAPWVWELQLAGGRLGALVQTEAEASKVSADGRYVQVWTAHDVGQLIDALPAMLADAGAFERAVKAAASKPIPNDLNAPPWPPGGDEIPFGEAAAEARP
jgi:hypothetical protein